MRPADAEKAGLGLRYGTVRLVPARCCWRSVAGGLIEDIRARFGPRASAVEHIGSTAVCGMLAKPIVDIAIRLAAERAEPAAVADLLEPLGYQYRGDAGDDGGLVFVLDVRPKVRVAHVHAVAHDDPQWSRYLAFVAQLRADADARVAYEEVKRDLARRHADDREAYTTGKTDVVTRLAHRPSWQLPSQ